MRAANCPDCDNRITLEVKPEKGMRITCPFCGADLEVIGLDPVELDWYYSELDDDGWDDYDDDDDDGSDDDWD